MAVSAARLAANRRNAQKSTGPRSEERKRASRGNALGHGCRAPAVALAKEAPGALEARLEAWRARFQPRDDAESYYLKDAVVNSWLLQRARRARTPRISTNIANDEFERAQASAREVVELRPRLFKDRMGPLTFYPGPPLASFSISTAGPARRSRATAMTPIGPPTWSFFSNQPFRAASGCSLSEPGSN
jgi:hypothetical protein